LLFFIKCTRKCLEEAATKCNHFLSALDSVTFAPSISWRTFFGNCGRSFLSRGQKVYLPTTAVLHLLCRSRVIICEIDLYDCELGRS
jgi:hypothetical protein